MTYADDVVANERREAEWFSNYYRQQELRNNAAQLQRDREIAWQNSPLMRLARRLNLVAQSTDERTTVNTTALQGDASGVRDCDGPCAISNYRILR